MLAGSISLPSRIRVLSVSPDLSWFPVQRCMSVTALSPDKANSLRVQWIRAISGYQQPAHSLHESSQRCPAPMSHRDWHCPVCLQTPSFPVQTNCGHLFCAPCLIACWRHGSWLDAISCPLCRQKVNVICHLFSDSRPDRQSKEVLGEITDYNKRYSGAPRRIADYLCDTPLFLQLLVRGLGTMGGLVWLFFFRVALCCVGTMVSFSSSTLEPASSSAHTPKETDPSLCGLLGVLDDLVVVILLLNCVINISQQMGPERGHATQATATRGVL